MNSTVELHTVQTSDRLRFLQPPASQRLSTLAEVVEHGLSQTPRSLPCRFFYDEVGSRLFERICSLPEYYLTRTEQAILNQHAPDMIRAAGHDRPISLIEFGSGSSFKTRLLIEAALSRQERLEYVPIDISANFLAASSHTLLADYPQLHVTAIAAEYNDGIHAIPDHDCPRLILFLGSNIGNFDENEAVEFLSGVCSEMSTNDQILMGVDLLKSPSIIEPAYNDAAGITEAFNKNLLHRINEELGADFDLDRFEHHAPFRADRSRIEMWLMSRSQQLVNVQVLGKTYTFAAGEGVHTENSHKFSHAALKSISQRAGLVITEVWTDPNEWFALLLLKPRAS